MTVLLTGVDGYLELIASLVVFVVVLAAALFSTRWIAKYQKDVRSNGNIEVMESLQLTANKYLQIVRIGERYIAIAVCKDTVTVLCEIPKEELKEGITPSYNMPDFKAILNKVVNKNQEQDGIEERIDEPKE